MKSSLRPVVLTAMLAGASLAVLAKLAPYPPGPVRINPQQAHPVTAGRIAINPQPRSPTGPPEESLADHVTARSIQINPQPLPPRY
jgi:hypothetical protein